MRVDFNLEFFRFKMLKCPVTINRLLYTRLAFKPASAIQKQIQLIKPFNTFFIKRNNTTLLSKFNQPKQSSTLTLNPNIQAFTAESTTNDDKTDPRVAYWMFTTAILVFSIVLLGGITRLTESGLSITEWNLIRGMKLPANESEWTKEFEKYKLFPEYKLMNHGMNMEEFKRIFWYEWAHRNLGRFIGVAFILPGVYFASRGMMSRRIKMRSLGIGCLIGFQGLLGWLMVKSGLSDDIIENKEVPRVNHLWLSAHLSSAFVIYSSLLATGLEIIANFKNTNQSKLLLEKGNVRFKFLAAIITSMVFITSISGAWVAGLDAGICC